MAKMPTANIFWREIPHNACVIDRGHYFEAKVGRKRHTVYWMGNDSREAQRTLARRAQKGCR